MDELLELNKHECTVIRSNLMEIVSCAERLELSLEDADVYEEIDTVSRIVSSCYKVLSAVINTEEMAKLDEYKPVSFCLSDLVDDMINVCRSRLRRSSVEFIAEIEDGIYVEADPDRLTSCLMNLIVNAIRNVDNDNGKIRIKISKLKGSASVIVSDNGYGANLEEIEKRLCDKDSNTGLAVVGKFCREAHTNIIVDDNADGGLVFSFRLPLASSGEITLKSRKSYIPDNYFSPILVYMAKVEDNPSSFETT
ncbi:MAG: HAMP domain-containing histidine kinase [Oscillospiraceae bacterium]|nr:HAMP domain-containing histidine kinase [Oscillospiraceae bacterium]